MKKVIGIIILGLLLSGNAYAGTYAKFLKKWEKKGYYVVMAESISEGSRWWISRKSYSDAANTAISTCNKKYQVNDCVLAMVSDRSVFEESKQDYQIQIAQSTCKKVGYTPGTDRFADCTIKMIAQAQAQGQGENKTVIIGQRKSGRIYPLHCRQMGGASAC